jgi:hypothetical protein
MRHPRIIELVANIKRKYGESYMPYATSDQEEEGTGFRIAGIEATFSAMCLAETPEGMYDIQIESYQSGNYLYNAVIDLNGFLSLIERYRAPLDIWPVNKTNQA